MTKQSLTKSGLRQRIEKFQSYLADAIEHIEEASRLYVETIDEYPDAVNDFREACPGVPYSAWAGFEAVGRGWLGKRLLWGGGSAASKLKRLTTSDQKAALDNGVDVLVSDGSALKVRVEDMTRKQMQQVFAADHIRSLGEQRAWLEDKRTDSSQPPEQSEPYQVRGNKLVINAPITLTRKEVSRLLWEMER